MKQAESEQLYCVPTNFFIENRLIFSILPSLIVDYFIRNPLEILFIIYYQSKSMSNRCRAFSYLCSAWDGYLFVPIFSASNNDMGRLLILTCICALYIRNFKQTTFLSKQPISGIEYDLFWNESYANFIDWCRVTAIHFIIFILGTIRYAIKKIKILIP